MQKELLRVLFEEHKVEMITINSGEKLTDAKIEIILSTARKIAKTYEEPVK
jgi:hypothetical protein